MISQFQPEQTVEWFRRIYRHAATGIAITELDGRVVQCNPAYTELLGYSESELQQRTFASLIHPEDREANLLQIRQLLAGQVPSFTVENRYVRADGQPIWVQKFVSLLPGADGKPSYILALVTDVSARRAAEAILRSALDAAELERRRLATVLDAIPAAVAIADASGRLVRWNRALETLWAAPSPAYLREHYHERRGWFARGGRPLGPRDWPMARALTATGSVTGETIEIERFDGTRGVTIYSTAAAIRDEQGDIIGSVAAQVDLTAQRQIEQALQASEATFRATFENAAVGIAHVDLQNRFIRVNATLSRITGYPHDELLTKSFTDITHPDDVAADLQQARRLAAGEIPTYAMEKRYIRKDGSTVWVNLTGSAVRDAAGALQYFIAIIEDITRRRLAEDELRAAKQKLEQHASQLEAAVAARTNQLEEVVKELGTFSYTVSHDLRAPLRTIRGFSDVLKTEFAEHLPAEARGHLDRIVRAGVRMDALITDVLEYSRMTRAELQIEPLDPAAIVDEVVETLGAGKAGAVEVVRPLPRVRASAAALRQCVLNLITNALKFARPTVPARVTVRGQRNGDVVRLWVEDNGIGIAPEHQERIWSMFERLNPTYDGTGVGLSIVRRAVDRMGGRVGVESAVGQGSRFWLELPAAG